MQISVFGRVFFFFNKSLMNGPKENIEFFFFSETLNVHQGEAEATIEVEGKQNPLFPLGPVINLLYLQPQSWKIKTAKKKKKK